MPQVHSKSTLPNLNQTRLARSYDTYHPLPNIHVSFNLFDDIGNYCIFLRRSYYSLTNVEVLPSVHYQCTVYELRENC